MKNKLILIILSLYTSFVTAQNLPAAYSIMDMKTGNYYESYNSTAQRPIASLTKLMTAYVFLRYIPDLEKCITNITQEDNDNIKRTKTKLDKYEPISCKKLLQTMLISSDNGAAHALARSIPNLSYNGFIKLMNEQAREWSMLNTQFVDSSGLSPKNISTVNNLNMLLYQTSKIPLISYLSSQKTTVYVKKQGQLLYLNNTNKLIRDRNYNAILSKTGYIKESGYNLIYVPDNCTYHNIAILILGAKSSQQRANFAENILHKYSCN